MRSEKNIVPVRNLCSGYQCDSVLHNIQLLFEEHLKKANSGSEEHLKKANSGSEEH